MLVVDHISKNYGSFNALKNVSFSMQPGEIAAFLGPNGAGKTTTMKIMTGVLLPDKGHVLFDNQRLAENPSKILKKIGYLPENNPLYSDMRVDDFLLFCSRVKDADNQKLKEIVKRCGLESGLTKKIADLSKGFQQRVGLAMALIGDPKYLILDEPTTGLDPNQKEEILLLIKNIAKDKTILFSSHILSEVTEISDRLIIINKGEIVANGNKKDLLDDHFKLTTLIVKIDCSMRAFTNITKKIPSIIEVSTEVTNEHPDKKSKYNTFVVKSKNALEAQEAIFRGAVLQGMTIIELSKQEQGLGELFKQLTK